MPDGISAGQVVVHAHCLCGADEGSKLLVGCAAVQTKESGNKKAEDNRNRMRNCLCVTHNPGDPPFRKWLKELLPVLHRDPSLRKLIPDIPVVTRQPPNVVSMAVRARHWKIPGGDQEGGGR